LGLGVFLRIGRGVGEGEILFDIALLEFLDT
jgi:hypothetical protein